MVLRNVLRDVLHDPDQDPLDFLGGAVILGASFDGTNDYLLRGSDLTGSADSKFLTLATRIRYNGGDGSNQKLIVSGVGFLDITRLATGNKYRVDAFNAGSTRIIRVDSLTSVVAASGYVNLLVAADLSTNTIQLYLNDADDANVTTNVDDTIDYTQSNWSICAQPSGVGKANCDMNFFYLNTAEYVDISVEANRRKFFTAGGAPAIDPTSNGSSVTGTAPIIYQAGLFDQWETNKGGGGGFTVTGALSQPVD